MIVLGIDFGLTVARLPCPDKSGFAITEEIALCKQRKGLTIDTGKISPEKFFKLW